MCDDDSVLADLTILQAKVLALMAWVDGQFDEPEKVRFREFLEASPADTDALRIELHAMVS